jgi:hypothetical protein
MSKKEMTRIQRGQAITFRLPSDTPEHIIKQLQKLKETERRNFSSKIAEYVMEGVGNTLSKERETVTIPLPKQLSKEQRNWLKHSHSEALIGSIIYQLLVDPVRATAVLATLNSNALDINQALYLVENEPEYSEVLPNVSSTMEDFGVKETDDLEDDLMNFDWDKARQEQATSEEDIEETFEQEDVEDLLGGFLANMNK